LLAKPTPRNLNLRSDRSAMFNKERDIPGVLIVTHNRITRQHRGTPSATWFCFGWKSGSHVLAKML
jgi:hypothetical protein